MYSYIKGILRDMDEESIVVETGGIGYHIYTTGQTFRYLPSVGEEVKVYTYLHVREDAMLLFGFLTKDELKIYKLLLGVSGIGPKGALAILSVMTTDDLRFAVLGDDAKAIAKAPGVGTKTAQRLILELKDKLSIDDTLISREIAAGGAQGILTAGSLHIDSEKKKEAVEALVALGYGQAESLKAVNALEDVETMDSGAILKAALKKLF